jgi:23S rRNA pseudouridine955/2504/2580 synthase
VSHPQPTDGKTKTLVVHSDDAEMRLDRFLAQNRKDVPFHHIQSLIRKGFVRVNGKRAKASFRLESGQSISLPRHLDGDRSYDGAPRGPESEAKRAHRNTLKDMTLYEDEDVLVLNKPPGLAVQGGPDIAVHVDLLLSALQNKEGTRPRLVHRLDRETSGCLVIAKTRFAAAALSKSFRTRSVRKIYWALVAGVPKVSQGRISTYMMKEGRPDGSSIMRVVHHGVKGSDHAVTYYAVMDKIGRRVSWVSVKPVTGRTHQIRVHMAHIGHPIIGDARYSLPSLDFDLPQGLQNRLHLLARRIQFPHPRTGEIIDVTAPLPPHMHQSWAVLGFNTKAYDAVMDSPDDERRKRS